MDLQECFDRVSAGRDVGSLTVRYGQYSELKHFWRTNGSGIEFVISDYMIDAPEDVMLSLANYLVDRSLHGSVNRTHEDRYLDYVHSKEFWSRNRSMYLSRSKNLILESKGACHDLGTVFDYVNSNYFDSRIEVPVLAWTKESPRSRVGYYFGAIGLLAVNKVLDTKAVPRFVLEFVMYHELLHHVDSISGRPVRRVRHTREFRAQERRFSSYVEAEQWLSRIVREQGSKNRSRGVPQG